MRTQPITIEVDPSTALQYNNASSNDRQVIAEMVRIRLNATKEERLQSLFALMERVSNRAKELGLTEAELEAILAEKD